MTLKIHDTLLQGSDEWLAARLGHITASEMKLLLTPKLKIADNDKTRQHIYELAAQRISQHVEPTYISDDMLRGHEDEMHARNLYSEKIAPVREVGLITNDRWGFTIAYSPDGLVGDDGLIECKSRRQKYHIQTIAENVVADKETTIPTEYVLQAQTGLLVSEREWLDFISYSNGLPMAVIRVWPHDEVQAAIIEAAQAAEDAIADKIRAYEQARNSSARLFPTERKERQEIYL
jgi:hypothetical protein